MPPSGQYNVFELSTTSNIALSAAAVASSTATAIASVIATTSGATVLQASNTARKGLIVYSCQGSNAPALVAYTTSATVTNFSLSLTAGAYWEMPVPLSITGMSVIVSTGGSTGLSATLLVTELS